MKYLRKAAYAKKYFIQLDNLHHEVKGHFVGVVTYKRFQTVPGLIYDLFQKNSLNIRMVILLPGFIIIHIIHIIRISIAEFPS